MYKFENEEQSSVCIPSQDIFCIQPGTYAWGEYQEWVSDGGITQPWKTEQELLEEARQAKIAEIDAAFAEAEGQLVSIGPHLFKGGFESGLALDAARRMMVEYATANPLAGITTVGFFDVNGATITLPLNSETELDALDVCLAIGQAAAANSFKCAQLVAAAKDATTVAEINAIHW